MQYSEGVQLLISYVWVARRWGRSRCTDDDDDDGGGDDGGGGGDGGGDDDDDE